MLDVQARLPALAGFRSSKDSPIMPKEDTTPTSKRESSVDEKSTCEGDSSAESVHSYGEWRMSCYETHMQQYRSEADGGVDDFVPSEQYLEMPSTREPSPEPFWDTAKRYGWPAENLFPPRNLTFYSPPEDPIPAVVQPLSYHPPTSVQCNPTTVGLSLDYLAKFGSSDGCSNAYPESEICNDTENSSTGATVSQPSFNEMQKESKKLNRDTNWIRVVHRGYGQVAWRNEMQKMSLPIVHGPFASEGDYVIIPEGMCARDVVDMLTAVNLKVRKIVWFRAMKRANKSRVLFKWEPFSVSPNGKELPRLLETKAFSSQD
jgi:hypothetical protein